MFKWKKLGRIFNPIDFQDSSWLFEFAQTPNTLIFDDFIRVYFTTRAKPNENSRMKSLLAYVDLDKKNLFNILRLSSNPLLELGNKGFFDEFGTYILAPIRISENVVRGYYVGVTCTPSVPINGAIGLAESYDNGETFHKIGLGPVLGYSLYEPFIISSHKIREYNDKFYMFYTAGYEWVTKEDFREPVYKLRMAVSDNGIDWQKMNKNLIEDKLGMHEAQACPDVFYKNGKYHMFFCYREPFDYRKNPANSYRIGYASSEDLINWQRDDSKAGIDISESGFDNEMIAYPHVFELEDKIYMLYLGNEVGRYGFGLAELEGDLI